MSDCRRQRILLGVSVRNDRVVAYFEGGFRFSVSTTLLIEEQRSNGVFMLEGFIRDRKPPSSNGYNVGASNGILFRDVLLLLSLK